MNLTLRVRTETGTVRITLDGDQSLLELYQLVAAKVSPGDDAFILSLQPHGQPDTTVLPASNEMAVGSVGLGNGDFVFCKRTTSLVKEDRLHYRDKVDEILSKRTGRIERSRDPQYCKHGDAGMCPHCLPLEPFDPEYLAANKIKYLSYYSYLRKISAGGGPLKRLEDPSYVLKANCPYHAPYPRGICSKCQPSAVILQPQSYRLVDHVEFVSSAVVEELVSGWRQSGMQRFAWMLGRWDVLETGVPLGIKAVVEGLYHPPQEGSIDGVRLSGDNSPVSFERITDNLGLAVVGMIYTDLRDDGTSTGRVQRRRGPDTFFLSSAECVFAARQQAAHPSGPYGSRFVTAVVTGDENGAIGINCYQVSQTAVALVQGGLVMPSTDPALMLVRGGGGGSDGGPPVPEVFYRERNEYGVEVQRKADPTFPVDYLLVTVTHGCPANPPRCTLTGAKASRPEQIPWTVEGLANLNNLMLLLQKGHISCEADLWEICRAIRTDGVALPPKRDRPILIDDDSDACVGSQGSGGGWSCPHCTFINENPNGTECSVCGLPRMH